MARDFRPKDKPRKRFSASNTHSTSNVGDEGSAKVFASASSSSSSAKAPRTPGPTRRDDDGEDEEGDSDEEVDEERLLKEIVGMGGTREDLQLVASSKRASKGQSTSKELHVDVDDVSGSRVCASLAGWQDARCSFVRWMHDAHTATAFAGCGRPILYEVPQFEDRRWRQDL